MITFIEIIAVAILGGFVCIHEEKISDLIRLVGRLSELVQLQQKALEVMQEQIQALGGEIINDEKS